MKKYALIILTTLILLIGGSCSLGLFWTSPDFYKVSEYNPLPGDVIGMKEYMESYSGHSSMITLKQKKLGKESVYVLGTLISFFTIGCFVNLVAFYSSLWAKFLRVLIHY